MTGDNKNSRKLIALWKEASVAKAYFSLMALICESGKALMFSFLFYGGLNPIFVENSPQAHHDARNA